MSTLSFVLGALATLTGAFALVTASHLAVNKHLLGAQTCVRLTGALTVAVGAYGLVFYSLVGLGWFGPFRLVIAIMLVAAGLAAYGLRADDANSWAGGMLLKDSERALQSTVWLYSGARRWISIPISLLLVANLLRSLVIPPLAWDSLTYHLVRAALWIRDSGLTDYDAPGAWQDYRALMPLGDALSAGVMILPSSDALVPLLWFGVWCFLGLSVYAAGRSLGADRTGACLGAGAVCLVPAVSGGMFVAYVDNLVGALSVGAFALFLSEKKSTPGWGAGLAMLALGAALASKKTALPFVAAGLCVFVVQVIVLKEGRVRRVVVGTGALLLLAGPPMVYLWVSYGSPLHPWSIDPSGLMRRVARLTELGTGTVQEAGGSGSEAGPGWMWLKYLFFEGYGKMFPLSHLGYGPAGPLIGLAGVAGLWRYIVADRSRIERVATCAFFAAGAVSVVAVFQYPKLDPNLARYSVGAIGLFGVGAAYLESPWSRFILGAAIMGHLVFLAPLNWGPSDSTATLYWCILSLPVVAISGLVAVWGIKQTNRRRQIAIVVSVFVLVTGTLSTLEPVRKLFRYDIYDEAKEGLSYSNHPLVGADSYESSNLWEFVDRQHHATTAVTVGWALSGLNWYVYPFFGSRLQNDIAYVPVTNDGQLMPLQEKRQRTGEASYQAWRRRLEQRDVEFVAALAPRPIEVKAMKVHTDAFELVAQGPHPENRLFRVVHEQR